MSGVIIFISLNLFLNYGSCGRVARQGESSSLLTTVQRIQADTQDYIRRNPAETKFNKIIPLFKLIEKMIIKQPELNYIGFSNVAGYNELLTVIQKKKEEATDALRRSAAKNENTGSARLVLEQFEKLEEIIVWKPRETSLNPKLPRACGIPQKLTDKIRGGNYVEPGALPWMAQLLNALSDSHLPFCGGSLVTRNVIITAAHCVKTKEPYEIIIRLGQVNASKPDPRDSYTKDFKVREIKIHPEYRDTAHGYDVALLILIGNANNNARIHPICLPHRSAIPLNDFNGAVVTVAGWGYIEFGRNQSPQLQDLKLEVVSNAECRKLYADSHTVIRPSMICARDREKGNKDACQGDSGGPLMLTQERVFLVGIVSFGSKNCGSDFTKPGVYARVTEFIDWIIENI